MTCASEAREALAAAMTAAGMTAFAAPPSTTPVPSITVNAATPYMTPAMNGAGYTIALTLSIAVQAIAGDPLRLVEELAERVYGALPGGMAAGPLSAPRLEYLGEGQGSVYLADIPITALVRKD